MSRPEFLLLHFDPAADFNAAHWIHCAADGEPQSAERSDPLEHIAAEAGGRTVIGLLPGTSVLAQRVSLPRANRKKRLQAVPYALEERLAADPDTSRWLRRPTNRSPSRWWRAISYNACSIAVGLQVSRSTLCTLMRRASHPSPAICKFGGTATNGTCAIPTVVVKPYPLPISTRH